MANIFRPRPLSRRHALKGAGVCIALPFLEAMLAPRRSYAAVPKRFIPFYSPGGTVYEQWRPTGSESSFSFGSILEPLTPLKSQLLIVDGLEIKVAQEGYGHPHTRGMAGVLTGQPTNEGPYETCGGKSGFANGPSIDQVIARAISTTTRYNSLYFAVRWPTYFYGGVRVAPTNVISYEAANKPIPPETDPIATFNRLFGVTEPGMASPNRKLDASVLDAVVPEYERLAQRLSGSDKQRVEEHLAKIREVELSLAQLPVDGAVCNTALGASLSAPYASNSAEDRCDGCVEASNDSLIPKTGKAMIDILVLALSCDLTRVITFQWMDLAANNSFPWLGLDDTHHGYQHDRGYQPDGIAKIDRWYAEQFKYLLDSLAAVNDGGATLLDNSLAFWFKEISHPNTHSHVNMPFVLGGSAGGAVRPGRFVQYPNQSHNGLLISLLNAFGVPAAQFGKTEYSSGPLSGLT